MNQTEINFKNEIKRKFNLENVTYFTLDLNQLNHSSELLRSYPTI